MAENEESPDEIQSALQCVVLLEAQFSNVVKKLTCLKGKHDSTNKELAAKKEECEQLKSRLKSLTCNKCSVLEKELSETKYRLDCISKILKMGKSQDSNSVKDSAIDIVSQLLISPARKRKRSNTAVLNEISEDLVPSEEIISETMESKKLRSKSNSPCMSKVKLSASVNIPPISPKKSPAVRKNLSVDFNNKNLKISPIKKSPVKKVDGKYDGDSELENIWFGEERSKLSLQNQIKSPEIKENDITVIEPSQCVKKEWMLKQSRTVNSEVNSKGKKLKQMKLNIKSVGDVKEKVELSQQKGYNGGLAPSEIEDDIILCSPAVNKRESSLSLLRGSTQDTTVFEPVATSTQLEALDVKPNSGFDRVTYRDSKNNKNEPKYAYERPAVRKKEERMKLEGWECENCEKYFEALKDDLSPNEIKKRMNKCSRHRYKSKPKKLPVSDDFWNPFINDTQYCKEKGMYSSIYEEN